jgi:hypothetical protein
VEGNIESALEGLIADHSAEFDATGRFRKTKASRLGAAA